MVREAPTGLGDLALLSRPARVGAFVIAAEQQDQAIAVRVAEDAQQDALTSPLVACGFAERAQGLGGVMSQPELEQSLAEPLAPTRRGRAGSAPAAVHLPPDVLGP